MATLTPSVTLKNLKPGQGRGGEVQPPASGGDGNGRNGNGAPDYGSRLRRARLGLAVAVVPITMLFVAFTSAYVVRQGLPTYDERTGTYLRDWLQLQLPVAALLVNTLLLLMSSVTVEMARRQLARRAALAPAGDIPGVSLGQERNFPWLGATVVLGVGFLTGQWMAWQEFAARGFYLATNPSSAFFYLLTAAHGIHLAGGLVVMLYAAAISLTRRPIETRCIVVDITAWYWLFMAVLWLYIFALLWFVG